MARGVASTRKHLIVSFPPIVRPAAAAVLKCGGSGLYSFPLNLLGAALDLRAPSPQKGAAMAPHSTVLTDISLNLALAVIASSTAPLLLLNGDDLTLIAASKSFCRAFQINPAAVQGLALRELCLLQTATQPAGHRLFPG